ncbi:MAG: SDR family NAD(P)-dependent oxidoreductase [Acidimicrobiales bacterium]
MTGAARGIGRVVALALAEAGADVVVCARRPEELETLCEEIGERGRRAVPCEVDLQVPEQVGRMADEATAAFGGIDVFVNNSGVGGPSAPVWEVDPRDWHETVGVNLTGAFLCCRAVLPSMVERRRGAIVFIGSITGKRPLLHRSPYAASKLGLVGLCRTVALDAGPYGIRANVVSPGFVEGPRMDWVIARQAEAQGRPETEVRSALEHQAPLERLVSASEVAGAVVYLAGDAAGGITGVDLNVAAGAVMY